MRLWTKIAFNLRRLWAQLSAFLPQTFATFGDSDDKIKNRDVWQDFLLLLALLSNFQERMSGSRRQQIM